MFGASQNRLIWLAVANRDGKQYDVETGTASINKTACLVANKDKYIGVKNTVSLE